MGYPKQGGISNTGQGDLRLKEVSKNAMKSFGFKRAAKGKEFGCLKEVQTLQKLISMLVAEARPLSRA